MSWRTNSLVVKLRNMGRILGLNGWIASFRSQGEYEALFDKEFSGGIQRGDCVWDVGANVGHFTRIFSERVGDLGRVFAFEPSRSNFHRLATACTSLKNVVLLPIGLGSVSGQLRFQQSVDGLGVCAAEI